MYMKQTHKLMNKTCCHSGNGGGNWLQLENGGRLYPVDTWRL